MISMLSNRLILLVLLGLCPSVQSTPLHIWFTYQSNLNTVQQFLTMFTLCLAPLVTHIAFGLPQTVVLADKGPRWTDKVIEFNPISIIWRYYAIAYRRLRATQWDAADMAACNALFWDGERWDGSEHMMIKSRDYLTSRPELSHAAFVSGSSLSTVALALQGVQAVFLMVTSASPNPIGSFSRDLTGLFVPLGLLGLLRLPAACWISSDFGYSYERGHPPLLHTSYTAESELEDWKFTVRSRLVDTRNWKCICYRIWWIATVLATMGLALYDLCSSLYIPNAEAINMSSTQFIFDLMYMQLTAGILLIHITYVLKREHVSTVIPCSQSAWYKLFTFLMVATAVAAVVVASLETIQLPSGQYVTVPPVNCTMEGTCGPINRTTFIESVTSDWLAFLGDVGVQ
jgi:hypothetical protein